MEGIFLSIKRVEFFPLFMVHFLEIKGGGFWQNVLELIGAKSDRKKYPARKSRKRKDSGDFAKKILPLQKPRRTSPKRISRPMISSIGLSGGKDFRISSTPTRFEPLFR
jgi:hypothetical protein